MSEKVVLVAPPQEPWHPSVDQVGGLSKVPLRQLYLPVQRKVAASVVVAREGPSGEQVRRRVEAV